jgi:hypothetical protein
MHLPHLTSMWRQRIEEEEFGGHCRAVVAEEEEACGHGRAVTTAEEACTRGRATVVVKEEASSSGIDDSGGDRWSRERVEGT